MQSEGGGRTIVPFLPFYSLLFPFLPLYTLYSFDLRKLKILIGLLMYSFDGTAAGVVHVAEGGVPFEGDGGGTSDAGL